MSKVINFHAVSDVDWFEKVVAYLSEKYEMIDTRQLYDYYYNGKKIQNACLITVDDGHLSSFDTIYPVLKKYNVPAVFFVSPLIAQRAGANNFWFQELSDYNQEDVIKIISEEMGAVYDYSSSFTSNLRKLKVDGLKQVIQIYQAKHHVPAKPSLNMTIEQIKQIDREGLVEIGAHTLLHPFLATETADRAKREIVESINQLEEILQHPIRSFAYPNGTPILDFTIREMEYLKETSVKLAFSTDARNISKTDDRYAIPRYGLTCGSIWFVKTKLFLGKYYLPIVNLLKRR